MKPIVLGADLSSKKLAFIAKVGGRVSGEAIVLAKTSERYKPERCLLALSSTDEYLSRLCSGQKAPVDSLAYVEAPYVRSAHGSLVQAFISGPVQACLTDWGFTVFLIPATQWKAEVVGKSHADKPAIRRAVLGRWNAVTGVCASDSDLIDAAGLCLYGELQARRQRRVERKGGV